MNTNTFFRTTKANTFAVRKFFKHVAKDIETQLREWDDNYRVEVETWRTYTLSVTNGAKTIRVALSKSEVELLQHTHPYALDEKLWALLERQGLEVADISEYMYIILNYDLYRRGAIV
jgi:hypothetical protein